MADNLYESSKSFRNFPCAHRRHKHKGHCAWIHGYSRSFTFWFRSNRLTENGFVMDFGDLKPVKAWLESKFDHTLLIDTSDPLMSTFKELDKNGACRLVTFESVGMEGTCKYVGDWVSEWIGEKTGGRVWLHSIEVRENDKNSARLLRAE